MLYSTTLENKDPKNEWE